MNTQLKRGTIKKRGGIRIELNWSFPSSINAVAANRSKTGCWTVSRINWPSPEPVTLAHFDKHSDALEFASQYPMSLQEQIEKMEQAAFDELRNIQHKLS